MSNDHRGSSARVYTIGHSTRTFDDVLAMLSANGVDTLVDIRSYPSSRAFPQWNREAIQQALPQEFEYRWMRKLGGRRHTPAGTPSPNDGWRVKAFRDYADYMATADFRAGLEDLISLVRADSLAPAIMCSEAVPWRCHRRLVTDALIVAGLEVHHIMSATSTKLAQITTFAHVEGNLITYPANQGALPI